MKHNRCNPFQKKDLVVAVYRNLHQEGVVYSARDTKGHVIFHSSHLVLKNARFVVRPEGSERVKATGKRNVHAFIKGSLVISPTESHAIACDRSASVAIYNPHKNSTFVDQATEEPVFSAKTVYLTSLDQKSLVKYIR